MHRVFISYHHANDQLYKEYLVKMGEDYNIFSDISVDTGDISDALSDEEIRCKIRDEYLRDSTVTIVLVGLQTKYRKHVDWEIYSSMRDSRLNKKSGILAINLPETTSTLFTAAHGDNEKKVLYPEITIWTSWNRKQYEENYPYMPERVVDNLLAPTAKISVTSWSTIANSPEKLSFLVGATFADRVNCEYDLSRPMRRKNG
jgi:hypothetical protein